MITALLAFLARWGAVGHLLIGGAAATAVPADMPQFFRASTDQLAYLDPEPDRWRNHADTAMDGAFSADHYIDVERIPPGALAAHNRFDYLDSLRQSGVNAAQGGLLPFTIEELTERLRQEFRLWRAATDPHTRTWIEARIVNDAGILGHYVADGSNPHHTTIHYDGWVGDNPHGYTTAKGFHARFETIYVQSHFKSGDIVVTAPPRVVTALRPAILEYLKESNRKVTQLYDLDKRAPFDSTTTDADDRRFAAERLTAGATMLRDLWWTAWVTSTNN